VAVGLQRDLRLPAGVHVAVAEEVDQDALLRQVNGELASMVAAEQARQAAEARAAAQVRLTATAVPSAKGAARPTGGAPARAAPSSPGPSGGSGDPFACIRQLESGNNYSTPGGGAYQFQDATWHAMGGTGSAQNASPQEQDMRAHMLQAQQGWGPWTTAHRCGLL
jgi:hypothetical protein